MKVSVTLVLTVLCSTVAFADATVDASLCNKATKPVEFHLFNHNDITAGAVALTTKVVRPCACVDLQTHTDLWHNFPVARINQLVFRDVKSVSGTNIEVCVSATGKFEGYIDATAKTCVDASKTTTYLPAPELTRAQGDLVILQSRLYPDSTSCKQKDWTGGCVRYEANYSYTDGAPCYGN